VQQADARCEAARLSVKAAEAQASIIDIAVGDAVVRAPFDGIVSKQLTDEGSFVQPPSPVIELQQIDPVTVVLQVPAVHVGLITMGQSVGIELPDMVELGRLAGTVTRIAPSLTRDTRALIVEVSLPNPDNKLRGGLFARGQIEVARKKSLAIPQTAVVDREDRLRFFEVRGGVAYQHILDRMEAQDGFYRAPAALASSSSPAIRSRGPRGWRARSRS
jgi:RND family efflux transporter MFP subunit